MIFSQPWWFAAALLPLLWGLWQWRRRGPCLRLPMDQQPTQQRTWQWRGGLARLASLLPALLAFLAIALLAGPSQEAPPGQRRSLSNIEFCLDVSGSMMVQLPGRSSDGHPITRYDAAMDAIELFSQQRVGDAFGLTIFGNVVLHWLPLTQDLEALARSRDWLVPNDLPRQFVGTRIGDALEATASMLQQRDPSGGDRMIILISDGQSADLGGNRPQRIIDTLAAADITVFAIAIGEEHQREVNSIVRASGGELFTADNQQQLAHCFAAIDALNPAQIEHTDADMLPWRAPWLIALAIAMALELGHLTLLRRLPW